MFQISVFAAINKQFCQKIFYALRYVTKKRKPYVTKKEKKLWGFAVPVSLSHSGLKIMDKKIKWQRLGISEDEEVMLGNHKIDQVNGFIYLGSIISKDGGSSEDVKGRIGVLSMLKKSLEKKGR